MKTQKIIRLFLIFLVCLFVGCAMLPQKANVLVQYPVQLDLLVRYPVQGEIVWMSRDNKTVGDPYFILDQKELMEFLGEMKNENTENN